nr:immunoglobulin heavy chain junction region [Mus musculus]
CARLWDRAYW